jgi:hypothetical protein
MKEVNRNLRLLLFGGPILLILLEAGAFWSLKDKLARGYSDFSSFYAACRIVKDGGRRRLYDYATQAKVQAEIFPDVPRYQSSPLVYNHPACEALFFLPLACLPYAWAYGVWTAINLVILLLVPLLLAPAIPEVKRTSAPFWLLSLISFFPAFMAVLQGQVSILLLLLFTLGYLALAREKEFHFGCILGLTLFKFQFAPFLILPFLIRRRWKALLGFTSVATVMALISVLVTGVRGAMEYAALLREENSDLASKAAQRMWSIYPSAMPNLRGAMFVLFSDRISEGTMKASVLGLSLLLVLWASTRWKWPAAGTPKGLAVLFSLQLSVMLISSYHLLVHDLSILGLPILLMLNELMGPRAFSAGVRITLIATAALFYLTPLYIYLNRVSWLSLFFWPLLLFTLATALALRPAQNEQG